MDEAYQLHAAIEMKVLLDAVKDGTFTKLIPKRKTKR
jgi:hypothetical protein